MGCCIGDALNKLESLQSRLEKKGQSGEATRVGQLKTRIEAAARKAVTIRSKMKEGQGEAKHLEGPAPLDKYYEECMKSGYKDKTKCAKLAWSIYCTHVNPGFEGCTSKGKDLNK
jgi:hypothetical protein